MPEALIRSVFDQYTQLENRVTHGLIQVLARDQRLARDFIKVATRRVPPKRANLSFTCQLAPGDTPMMLENEEERATARGIPDAWIYFDRWALLIESKITATLRPGQLTRHVDTARRRGFEELHLLTITADERPPAWFDRFSRSAETSWCSWAQVYEFLSGRERYSNPISRFLGQQFLEYLTSVEARKMAGDRILTTFTGIPFDEANPYSESEARVVLRGLMRNLRPKLAASRVLPVSSEFDQKPLTGPWDVVNFQFAHDQPFTQHPHLTVSLGKETVIQITLPNAAKARYWRSLRQCDPDLLERVLLEVASRTRPLRRSVAPGLTEPRLVFEVLQRHFRGVTRGTEDAGIRFDLNAALVGSQDDSVKIVRAWLPAACAILRESRRANMQAQLQVAFPYSSQSISHTPEFVAVAKKAAEALQPFLELLAGDHVR